MLVVACIFCAWFMFVWRSLLRIYDNLYLLTCAYLLASCFKLYVFCLCMLGYFFLTNPIPLGLVFSVSTCWGYCIFTYIGVLYVYNFYLVGLCQLF